MTAGRWFRVLWVPAAMFAIAGFFAWQGIRILAYPSNQPVWLGLLCMAIAAFKALLWGFFTFQLVRHPEAVMAARHWD